MLEDLEKLQERHRLHSSSNPVASWLRASPVVDIVFFFLLVMLLTVIFSPVALLPPDMPAVGSITNHTIKANRNILVEDPSTTLQRRELAMQAVLSVYDHDTAMMTVVLNHIREAILWLDQTRGSEQLDFKTLSKDAFKEMKQSFAQRLDEDEDEIPDRAFETLLAMEFYYPLLDGVQSWLNHFSQHRVVANADMLKDLSRASYVVRSVNDKVEMKVSGAADLIDLEGLRSQMVKVATEKLDDLSWPIRKMLIAIARDDVRPNLLLNMAETKLRRQKAWDSVEPVFFQIRLGEVVIREGEVVTEAIHLKVNALNQGHWSGVVVLRIIGLATTLSLFFWLSRQFLLQTSTAFPRDRKTAYILGSILAVVALACLSIFTIGQGLSELFDWHSRLVGYLLPVSLGAALASLIVGARVALPGGSLIVGAILATLSALMVDGGLPFTLYYLIGALVGGFSLRSCRRRSDVLRAGLMIGMVQAVSVPMIELLAGNLPSWIWFQAMTTALVSGLLAGFLGLALIPLFELLFNVSTDSRLLELASGDHPLLKQLSLRAPGTYHHSVMMGNLAEAAAESIGANPLMARIMALYHDIGKVVMPKYFVENQSGVNPHDQLSPSMSTKVIMAHIKHGVELAKEYNLGGPILEAITEHQGTTRLQFFYNKAITEAAKRGEEVEEIEFRYPGPRPRSREAGIIMLADSVEAAARTLKNPSSSQIQALIKRLVDSKIQDGQMDECKLTMREVATVADAFARVLTLGFYHRRIEYPDQVKRRKEVVNRHGSPDSGQPAPAPVARKT